MNPGASASPALMSTVPQHALEASRRRLLMIGLVGAALAALESVTAIVGGASSATLYSTVPVLVLCVALAVVQRSPRVSTLTALRFGIVALVTMTCIFSCLGGLARYELGAPAMPAHWATVFMMMLPMVVPMTPRTTATALMVGVASAPVGVLFVGAVTAYDPTGSDMFSVTRPMLFVAVISFFASRSVRWSQNAVEPLRKMGSYTLIRQIGRGGMGEVWAAEHALFKRPAAVKLLGGEPGRELSMEQQSALFEEASVLATLRSAHTVSLFDFGVSDDGRVYFAMELLDGIDLDQLVKEYGPVEPSRVVWVLRQVLLSLAEAHQNGVVHGDIKPANLFVSKLGIEYDFVKVLDFGLARRLDLAVDGASQGLAEMDSGTPAYMAPETAIQGIATPRSDLYSVGCVGYWMLTGHRLFEGGNDISLGIAHMTVVPTLPQTLRPDLSIPDDLQQIIMKALHKEPSDRFRTAAEFRDALGALDCADEWVDLRARAWWDAHRLESAAHSSSPAAAQRTPAV
jgi:serine/threonine-protein kinase